MASASPLKSVQASVSGVHAHSEDELCPVCDQVIPNEKLEEVRQRFEARQKEQARMITTNLEAKFAQEKAIVDANAKAAVEDVRRQGQEALAEQQRLSTEKETTAHAQGRQEAASEGQEEMAKARQALEDLKASSEGLIKQVAQEKVDAEQLRDALTNELAQARSESAAALEREKQQATEREAQIRAEVEEQSTVAVREQIAAAQQTHQASEAALNERLAAAEAAKTTVEQAAAASRTELEGQLLALNQSVDERLQEQREALEKAKDLAVNVEKSAAFEANQKLSDKVTELQRTIEKKTAEELGEGAEVEVFEALKAAFPEDRIERIHKGEAGADIRHVVMLNGQVCGKILYDSKNHKAWRNEFVSKLSTDQMAEKADHAVLSVLKFPAGARHLEIRERVIVANPGRVVAVVEILRWHLLEVHTRRVSNEQRAQKTSELYDFMTSDRCGEMFSRIDTHTDALLAMQVKEKKAHDKHWKDQGILLSSILKVNAEIGHEIGTIIGTAAIQETGNE
jgi:hypothetical protein